MEKANLINKFAQELSTYVTNLSIDCVIMGLINNELHVLVLRWKETKAWGLPGGFIKKDEGVDDAARRILKRRTNIMLLESHFKVVFLICDDAATKHSE